MLPKQKRRSSVSTRLLSLLKVPRLCPCSRLRLHRHRHDNHCQARFSSSSSRVRLPIRSFRFFTACSEGISASFCNSVPAARAREFGAGWFPIHIRARSKCNSWCRLAWRLSTLSLRARTCRFGDASHDHLPCHLFGSLQFSRPSESRLSVCGAWSMCCGSAATN